MEDLLDQVKENMKKMQPLSVKEERRVFKLKKNLLTKDRTAFPETSANAPPPHTTERHFPSEFRFSTSFLGFARGWTRLLSARRVPPGPERLFPP
jgi:hypothetical protein